MAVFPLPDPRKHARRCPRSSPESSKYSQDGPKDLKKLPKSFQREPKEISKSSQATPRCTSKPCRSSKSSSRDPPKLPNALLQAPFLSQSFPISHVFQCWKIPSTKLGTAECAERLNLTSRGNGKRSFESAVKMLLAAVIFGICYFVLVFIAICSDLLLFDATCCYLLPLAAARC